MPLILLTGKSSWAGKRQDGLIYMTCFLFTSHCILFVDMQQLFSVYFSLYFTCRYAATGSCNVFVFIVTWVLLDTSEASTSSDQLGSADASAFMVSGFYSLVLGFLNPVTDLCSWNF